MQLVGIQAQPDGEVLTHAFAGRTQHFQQQAHAVLQRTAVFVLAAVVIGREEAGDDVVVPGVDFHPVETGALGAFGGGGEPLDHLPDVVLVHHAHARLAGRADGADEVVQLGLGQARHHVGLRLRRDGRHPQLAAFGEVAHGDLAGMLQLHGDLRAVAVHPLGEAGQAGNEAVIGNADLIGLGGAGRVGDGAHAHGQQAGATGGAGLVVGLDALAAGAVGFRVVRAHRGHDDAVAQLQPAEAAGGKQIRVSVHRGMS
ncbi:hypothetical protein D3C76_546460 [compost metagenome]